MTLVQIELFESQQTGQAGLGNVSQEEVYDLAMADLAHGLQSSSIQRVKQALSLFESLDYWLGRSASSRWACLFAS